jgi:sulfatase modifying factor 1
MAGIAASAAVLGPCSHWATDADGTAPARPTPESTVTPGGVEMVRVEAGSFVMGWADGPRDERPAHEVLLTKSFTVARYTVTFEQYDVYCEDVGKPVVDGGGWGRGDRPIFGLNYYDALAYCNWLSEREGLAPCYGEGRQGLKWDRAANGYRLPTEAEWEYAARGGSFSLGYLYAGGDDPDAVAWYADNSAGRPHPVGQKAPNELGLYDMSGNVWEFCWDRYAWNFYLYADTPSVDPKGFHPLDHPNVVLRGGSFSSGADALRATARGYDVPVSRGEYGMRLVRTA